jgi:hypothetical protein
VLSQRSPSHPIWEKQDAPGTSRAHPGKRPSSHQYPSGGSACRACLPGGWLSQSGGASSPSLRLHRSERHVPGLPLRTLGNYYGRVGARGRGLEGGVGAEPKLPTLLTNLPQLLSMPSCAASPLGGLSTSKRMQLLRVFVAAGWRQAVTAAGGGVGVCEDGECSGRVYTPELEKAANPTSLSVSPPSRAAPERPLPTHSGGGVAEILCRTIAGLSFA